jgi:hypothetical protein
MNHIDWMISNALKNVSQVCLTVDLVELRRPD